MSVGKVRKKCKGGDTDGEDGGSESSKADYSRLHKRRFRPEEVGKFALSTSNLPLLSQSDPSCREALFREKLELCCVTFDFFNVNAFMVEKSKKKLILEELIDHTKPESDITFSEETVKALVKMIRINLFNAPLPPVSHEEELLGFSEVDEVILETMWTHAQPVYQLFLNFIVHRNAETNIVRRHITPPFIRRFMELFDVDDAREREYVKTLLHRMYGRFLSYRAGMRKMIAHTFHHVVYETGRHHGIAEILEFLGSIVNGFAVPLKEEHAGFLKTALIPLLKPSFLLTYQLELSYCLTQFVEKDLDTSVFILKGLQRYWPVTSTSKQLIYLQLLEDVLEIVVSNVLPEYEATLFAAIYDPICEVLKHGFRSMNLSVVERTCYMWTVDFLCDKFLLRNDLAFHELLPRLYATLTDAISTESWSTAKTFLVQKVINLYEEIDGVRFQHWQQQWQSDHETEAAVRKQAGQRWAAMLNALPTEQQQSLLS